MLDKIIVPKRFLSKISELLKAEPKPNLLPWLESHIEGFLDEYEKGNFVLPFDKLQFDDFFEVYILLRNSFLFTKNILTLNFN